jgi:hypothetical protein
MKPLTLPATGMGAPGNWDVPAVDLEQACAFLARLGYGFTFQTFDESGRQRKSLTRTLHGNLSEHADTLARLNVQGAGVFVMVNAGDGKARKASNVRAVRAVFADLDGAPLAPVRAFDLAPHIIVESSPGRWHAYWLTDDLPLEQFKPLQQAIASRFASDPKVCDLPRVMRLPGFLHNKGEPFLSRVIEQHDMPRYPLAALVEAFGAVAADTAPAVVKAPARVLPDVIPEGKRNSALFDLAFGLVRRGIPATGVKDRMQAMNVKLCRPPLCSTEVDAIAARASAYGSQGFDRLPHALTDSAVWASLPPAACVIVLAFFRRYDGFNNGSLCVPWSDFAGQHGMTNSGSFYAHLRRIVNAGILIRTVDSRRTQTGTAPARYAIADAYLPVSRSALSAPSAECSDSTVKQITALGSLKTLPATDTHGAQA